MPVTCPEIRAGGRRDATRYQCRSQIDYRLGVVDAHRIEILIQHAHEDRVPATHLEARHDCVENAIVQLVGHAIRVDAPDGSLR